MADTGKVVFVDFDKTIVDCNSANEWFMYELRAGRMPALYALRMPLWTLQYRLGVGNIKHMFDGAFMMVKGEREDVMSERVRDWFNTRIRTHIRPGALDTLRRHREAGDRLVLATSSSQYVGTLATELLGLDDFVSTRLEVVDGRFTGRLVANAMGPAKAVLVAQWAAAHGADLRRCTFYTDSITDLALLEQVGNPIAVNPDRRLLRIARERGWPVLDWGRSDSSGPD